MVQVKISDSLMCGFEGTGNLIVEFISYDDWVMAFFLTKHKQQHNLLKFNCSRCMMFFDVNGTL
jgi:hypothetical protein